MEDEIIEIESCMDETGPPRRVSVPKKGGGVAFWADLKDITYRGMQLALQDAERNSADPMLANAVYVAHFIAQWSEPELTINAESILRLHPVCQHVLARTVKEITEPRIEVLGNLEPRLTSNSTSPKSAVAATGTTTD